MNLYGKNIVLTGASRGLGFELACHLFEQGANLLLVSRCVDDTLRSWLMRHGTGVPYQTFTWVQADLYESDAIKKIEDNFKAYFSSIDVLINNAATQHPIERFWNICDEEWERNLYLNLTVPANLMRLFLPYMIKQNSGRIINLSGGGASNGRTEFSAYATAKTGLVRLTETVALELSDTNITANCVAPGAMPTAMMHEVIASGQANATEKEKARKTLAQNNDFSKPLALIDWLISPESSHVTGRLLSATWDDYRKMDFTNHPEFGKLRRAS